MNIMRRMRLAVLAFILIVCLIGCRGGGTGGGAGSASCTEVEADDGTYYCCSKHIRRVEVTNRADGCDDDARGKPCDRNNPRCRCEKGFAGLCTCQ